LVPSEVKVFGGGRNGMSGNLEWVGFYINIPLDPVEQDAENRRFLAKLDASETDQVKQEHVRLMQMNSQTMAQMVAQYRVGHFQVDCRVLDGEHVIGVGRVDLEILFKGHFAGEALPKK
jgi:hypothetical protein